MDNGVNESDQPPEEVEPGVSGDYVRALNKSCFKDSNILRRASGFIEAGLFEQGVTATEQSLVERGVKFEFVSKETDVVGTELQDDGSAIFRLSAGFADKPACRQLYTLLNRNMSLVLRRSNVREDPKYKQQILDMDKAYIAALRRAAKQTSDSVQKEIMLREAFNLGFDVWGKQDYLKKSRSLN